MRQWNLIISHPYALTLAADARLTSVDYFNDHIWCVALQGREPPSLMVFTTYGLRAASMRIFPIFSEKGISVYYPQDFFTQPCIRIALPNYLNLLFSPFQGIEVGMEVLVPHSHALLGRFKVSNQSDENRDITLQLAAQLIPNQGEHLTHEEIKAAKILAGKCDNLAPVIFIQGGAEFAKGSFPGLQKTLLLPPHSEEVIAWAQVAEDSIETSLEQARSYATFNWSAERARLEMLNKAIVHIYTSNPEWDATLFFSQKEALNLLIKAPLNLPYTSCVSIRNIDQGFSRRGDGSDYNHFWNGQTPLEVFHMANILLSSSPEIIGQLVENFLAIQREDGFIDLKPGLSGQRSQVLATPILAELAWRVYLKLEDDQWLNKVYPALIRFVRFWFSSENDHDADGIPEWSHPLQLGTYHHPLYSEGSDKLPYLDISKTESPALCAFLYNECQVLLHMAEKLSLADDRPFLETCMRRMQKAIESMWNEEYHLYMDWDRDTHLIQPSVYLGEIHPNEILELNLEFRHPQRLVFQITSSTQRMPHFTLVVHAIGYTGSRRVYQISSHDFLWSWQKSCYSSSWLISALEKIELIAQDSKIHCEVFTFGTLNLNLSGILPWWAGIEISEEIDSHILQTLLDVTKFWQPFGLPFSPPDKATDTILPTHHVSVLWNNFCIESLIRRGYKREASTLFTKLLNATTQTLKKYKSFSSWYDAYEGYGRGEQNELSGLLPVDTYLNLIGVHLFSTERIYLEPPLPPHSNITIQYKGLTIFRGKEKTTVTFPNGQSVIIDNDHPQLISLGDAPFVEG